MTKIKLIVMTALLAVLLVSCDWLLELLEFEDTDDNTFYAQDMKTGKFYTVQADIIYPGKNCVIWAEKGSGAALLPAAIAIANKYDNEIRQKVVDAFSDKNFKETIEGEEYQFADMLDYANQLAGRDDKKLTILLLDIKDGYSDPAKDSYIAGYFFIGDLYEKGYISGGQYSNGRDMIYIDTNPGLKPAQLNGTYATLAHELQHMVNYVTSVHNDRRYTDSWVDEGLSAYAEYLYFGDDEPVGRCDWFSDDPAGTIAKGNNFFVWNNHTQDNRSLLDEYATVYLFFRWMHLQAGGDPKSRFFYDIVTSEYYDYRSVTNVAKDINPAWSSWEKLLGTWFDANYNPKNTSYGYKGSTYLQNTIKITPIADESIALYPGEGVYSIRSDDPVPAKTGNIRYEGLSGNGDNMLLTFNANTVNTNSPTLMETGELTGVEVAASLLPAPGRSAGSPGSRGPYVIDARDVLGRDNK